MIGVIALKGARHRTKGREGGKGRSGSFHAARGPPMAHLPMALVVMTGTRYTVLCLMCAGTDSQPQAVTALWCTYTFYTMTRETETRRVLITGGTGYLGYRLGRRLSKEGCEVILLDVHSPHQPLLPGMTYVSGSVADADKVIAAAEGVDAIFHVASYGMSGKELRGGAGPIRQVNIGGTANVIEACRRNRVPRLVYVSTNNVYFTGWYGWYLPCTQGVWSNKWGSGRGCNRPVGIMGGGGMTAWVAGDQAYHCGIPYHRHIAVVARKYGDQRNLQTSPPNPLCTRQRVFSERMTGCPTCPRHLASGSHSSHVGASSSSARTLALLTPQTPAPSRAGTRPCRTRLHGSTRTSTAGPRRRRSRWSWPQTARGYLLRPKQPLPTGRTLPRTRPPACRSLPPAACSTAPRRLPLPHPQLDMVRTAAQCCTLVPSGLRASGARGRCGTRSACCAWCAPGCWCAPSGTGAASWTGALQGWGQPSKTRTRGFKQGWPLCATGLKELSYMACAGCAARRGQ